MADQVPAKSNPIWKNWTEDVLRKPSPSGEYYYFSPRTRDELKKIVLDAANAGVQIRVSGQRHSQPPVVIEDDRDVPPYSSKTWLVDLSCYADLGPNGTDQYLVDEANLTVTVNAGVREDYLDSVLAIHKLIFQTVTAGGFFSIGGMTSIDVHGASVDVPIFAETVVEFTIMGADGEVTVIDESTEAQEGWKAIQFARVNMGALGIVTSIKIKVLPRPYATTLDAELLESTLDTREAFIDKYQALLTGDGSDRVDRVESFLNPYDHTYLMLCWKLVDDPKVKQANITSIDIPTACHFAAENSFGAPYESKLEEWGSDTLVTAAQYWHMPYIADEIIKYAFKVTKTLFNDAKEKHCELWLTEAARVSFISYFIKLPKIDSEGLGNAWDALQVVSNLLETSHEFLVVGPMEFRFVKGGNTALAGTYCDDDETWYCNMDVIGWVPSCKPEDYNKKLLNFFAAVEREWYESFDGFTHNGKMYGFYDPEHPNESSPPFNKGFMADMAKRRKERMQAFEIYRKKMDPEGRFLNDYVRDYGLG